MSTNSSLPSWDAARWVPHPRHSVFATLVAASALSADGLRADTIPMPPEPAPAAAIREPERPHHVSGVLYWQDHRLAALCGEVGGRFSKLASSSVYACTHGNLADAEAAS